MQIQETNAAPPSFSRFLDARARIADYVLRTPLVRMSSAGVYLKAESLQPVGSFKIRGAFNAIALLPEEIRRRGVVAHSSGNHGQAVAWAASCLSVPATIVMPSDAPLVKTKAVARLGAIIVTVGPSSEERAARASELAASEGLTIIEPFDAEAIIDGAGTIALEILEDLPDIRRVYVPVSGGGLIAGIAAAMAVAAPNVEVIGVEPEVAADARASLAAGERVAFSPEHMALTMADGLRVQCLGLLTWPIIRDHISRVETVAETAILDAMRRIALQARLVAEPSGAVAAAAALAAGEPLSVAILSGGNVDPSVLARAFEERL